MRSIFLTLAALLIAATAAGAEPARQDSWRDLAHPARPTNASPWIREAATHECHGNGLFYCDMEDSCCSNGSRNWCCPRNAACGSNGCY